MAEFRSAGRLNARIRRYGKPDSSSTESSNAQANGASRSKPWRRSELPEVHRVRRVKLVVVLPVGPQLRYEFIADTIDSIAFYTRSDYAIIAIDDSGTGVGAKLKADYPSIDVIAAPGRQGITGGLYLSTSMAFAHALERYEFSVVLRLDTDALIIGPDSEVEAEAFFARHPEVGLLGSYRVGCDGNTRDFAPPRRTLEREMSLLRAALDPRHLARCAFLRRTVKAAVAHGYEYGEHCLAAATFFSAACVRRLAERELLNRAELRTSRLGDDHIFGLLVMAAGLKMADFATGDLPMGVRYRGLPFAPGELLERKKRITHSTKFWQDLDEEQIRAEFRAVRAPGASA
jgi:hypothetical protein